MELEQAHKALAQLKLELVGQPGSLLVDPDRSRFGKIVVGLLTPHSSQLIELKKRFMVKDLLPRNATLSYLGLPADCLDDPLAVRHQLLSLLNPFLAPYHPTISIAMDDEDVIEPLVASVCDLESIGSVAILAKVSFGRHAALFKKPEPLSLFLTPERLVKIVGATTLRPPAPSGPEFLGSVGS